ncbi:uncharacterized protein BYT42DRAFT_648548 [Radiomyces spectabilis]|uniref:uncharacterized protein n=1 Tax=Radiomyces spectabilis TaxID=64574 RepID=UPI00221E47AB|nr:uncharacterized protein BYT42DRAFT_648548 [Radiomyces spectabilis]KAI8367523.1 hypothetical protein BYT42DRAFT_648548 [Radiomyces spectabilis]
MGVQGLWSLLEPSARPVQLESLRNRKLAVDASIWIHQFMRTMRDKEGNALRNGHLLGFFRRLCKLLFYNIKPVFVFDGGAPVLKRSTIRDRRRRREGMVTNLKRTAEKILSAQVKSRVLMEEERRREGAAGDSVKEENYVYFDELEKSAAVEELRQRRKRDQYELPTIPETSVSAGVDPRLATKEELKEFVEEFKPEDLDMDSETFQALPPEIQYEVIQDIKLKSRQTSWKRLDEMVRNSKNALDFSKQQIKQLAYRNEMTQRLLKMNEVASKSDYRSAVPSRIASERGREYILVKNENIDQGLGWRLPGLSTADKNQVTDQTTKSSTNVVKDVMPEPESLETGTSQGSLSSQSGDKVKDAIAANPALAALFADLSSEEEEEDETGQPIQEQSNDLNEQAMAIKDEFVPEQRLMNDETMNEEPLFMDSHKDVLMQGSSTVEPAIASGSYSSSNDVKLLDDMRAYVHDEEAIDDVISKIYGYEEQQHHDQPTSPVVSPSHELNDLALDPQDYHQLWLSRVPDAFVYLHSFNDEYKKIIYDAIFEKSPEVLRADIKSLGKASAYDELTQESLAFRQRFLETTYQWKSRQLALDNATNEELPPTKVDTQQEALILDDDEEEEGMQFQFMETAPVSQQENAVPEDVPKDPKIDITQSTLSWATASQSSQPSNFQADEESAKMDTSLPKPDSHGLVSGSQGTEQSLSSGMEMEMENEPASPIISKVNQNVKDDPVPTSNNVAESITEEEPELTDKGKIGLNIKDEPVSTSNDNAELAGKGQVEWNVREEAVPTGNSDAELNVEDEPVDMLHQTTAENRVFDVPSRDPTPAEVLSNENEAQTYVQSVENQIEEQEVAEPQGYNSDEEVLHDVAGEENEYARFISSIADKDIQSVREELYRDMKELNKQQRKEMGNTDDITQQMVQDIQELLRLFGIPYMISPMEAEAQCAELLRLSLIEGVVTDDSDVFLFGASRVYKNMFNQQKYVECYVAQDVEREMQLDRKKLIQLAFLLGSDYTDGIPGVGPVAAMEILDEFHDPNDDKLEAPLEKFRAWYESKEDHTDFQRRFRKRHKDLEIPEDFPSPLVKEAYYHPMVDSSGEPFEWGAPQLDMLRIFLMEAFTWSEKKADEVLLPVIQEMNKRALAH